MLEIDRLDGQINNRTSSSQREAAEKKITKLQGEIDQIYREEQGKVAPTTPQAVTEEVTTELEAQMPESDQNVLNVVSERIEPILDPLTQRMTNAEEIDMAEIEAVAEQMIDEQARILESENLSEEEKQSISQLIELQIDNILSYEFATITTTEQAGEKQRLQVLLRLLGKEDPFQNQSSPETDSMEQESESEEKEQEESPSKDSPDSEEDQSMESPSETEKE